MTLLTGIADQPLIAFFYNNILVQADDGRVIGVLLGNCIFGWDGKANAKYFNHTLFTLEGNILARGKTGSRGIIIDTTRLREEAWRLIARIKDHTCPFINPQNKWTPTAFIEYFPVR